MTHVTPPFDPATAGASATAKELFSLVYDELRMLAAARLAKSKPGQTLQPTALVHEAYLRLLGGTPQQWSGRGHFFGAAAEAMRRILVDNARRKRAEIHGGDWVRVALDHAGPAVDLPPDRLLALDEALDRLGRLDPVAGQLVQLKYFAGLSVEEAAGTLGLSRATAYRHWSFARAWLICQLPDDDNPQAR